MTVARTFMRGARKLLSAESDPRAALLTITFVALFRLVLEHNLQGLAVPLERLLDLLADRLVFYAALYALFVGTLHACVPGDPRGSGNIVAVGLLFGLLPPVLAGFAPGLAPGGYAYLSRWQWLFYDASSQALSETVTLWTTVLACGAFVLAITRSPARSALAASLAYAGLAWIMVVLPSWLLAGSALRGAPEAWRVRVAMIASAVLLGMAAHPSAARALVLRRLPRTLPHIAAAGVASLLSHASAGSVALRAALFGFLWLAPRAGEGERLGASDAAKARSWMTAMAFLLLVVLVTPMPRIALLGALIVLVGVARRAVATDAGLPSRLVWVLDALALGLGIAMGAVALA